MQRFSACLGLMGALLCAPVAIAQIDPNTQTRDLGLPPAVTPNLPPALNPNLPPPTGKRYLPGASGPFANPDAVAPGMRGPLGYSSSGQWIRGEIHSNQKMVRVVPQTQKRELDRLNEIVPYLRTCWVAPASSGPKTVDATVRMSLTREGRVFGVPRIAYVNKSATPVQQQELLQSMASAIRKCEPFPLSASLGKAVAGRIFVVRFFVEPQSSKT